MSVLWWLAIPLLATLLALVWAQWSNRTRGPAAAEESVESYERFRAALAPDRRR